MKLLIILFFLTHQPDTIKSVYQKIDEKTAQINKLIRKPKHSIEDVYKLEYEMHSTLNQSHALTRTLLIKQDSVVKALVDTKKLNTLILESQQDMKINMITNDEFRRSREQSDNLFRKIAIWCGFGTILISMINLAVKKYYGLI